MDEKDKRTLEEWCRELAFDDDITEFQCVQCKNVAIDHFTSDCNHVFCRICKEQYGDDVYYRCPKCQATITAMKPNDPTFDKNLLNLIAYCPNTKNGCGVMSTLKKLPGHLRQCRHVESTQAYVKQLCEEMMKTRAFTSLCSTVQNIQKEQSRICSTMQEVQEEQSRICSTMQEFQKVQSIISSAMQEVKKEQRMISSAVQKIHKQLSRKSRTKKEKENVLKDVCEEQQQQPQTNDHSSHSQLKMLNSAAPSSSGLNDVLDNTKSERLENSTIETSDSQNSPPSDPQAIEKLELQSQMVEMQNEIEMLKAQVENQQPADHTPGPSNHNMGPLQMESSSPLDITNEGPKNENGQSLNGIPKKEYNILLLGQTGVGKSTFINAIANYLTYTSLKEANDADLVSLIPCQFSISDENFTQRIIQFGQDANENMGQDQAQSSTQQCRTYRFSLQDFVVRMIDSPGIGDTRGIAQDRLNLENIFTFITQYEELHAICILLKPNESKLTSTFQFCITQLLCQLHENASKNIIFIFTNSRNTFYRPGDTIAPLKTILGRIKGTPPCIEIPFLKENTFCLDSEAFRFLVAVKHGVDFDTDDKENFSISWNKSVEECYRMIRHVVEGPEGRGLPPHSIQDTTSINEARKTIVNLSKPLAETAKLLQDNIQTLNLKLKEVDECKGDVSRLKETLYIPTLILKITELGKPRTVCIGEKCRQVYKVGNLDKHHYPVICHDPCYMKDVPVDVVGLEQLQFCNAMNRQTALCCECGCHYSKHLHIYYESELKELKKVDQNIESQLKTKEGAIEAVRNTVKILKEKEKDYKDAHALLTKYSVKLAVFLQQNALVSRNDAFEEHLKQEIENEMSLNAVGANNADLIDQLKASLQQYKYEKDILDKVLSGPMPKERMTTNDVMDLIKQLPQMNIWGITVNQMVQAQVKMKKNEIAHREVSAGSWLKAGKSCCIQ